LLRDGFLRAQGRLGTFDSDHPPHLYRYALAFPSRSDGLQGWTDWWTILEQAAATVVRSEPQKQIVSYYEITGHADVEHYQQLLADVRARRLAGIILLTAPYSLVNTPLLDDCPVPRVYIGGDTWQWKIPSVSPSLHDFINRALEHAAGQSRRRPMFLSPDIDIKFIWPLWSEACRRHGIEPAREQIQFVMIHPPAPRHLTQLIMQLPAERRPDALVIADDHFVEEITAGLLASNLPESELPAVIAHANFPKPPHAHLPVTFLGYDSVQMIRSCIEVLDAQRRGETPPRATQVPAVFDSELVPSRSELEMRPPTARRGTRLTK
jgi:DNA-binding LacI/PurR family transcriptional regulator